VNRAELERNLLLALNAADGVAMPESALVRAALKLSTPASPTTGDVLNALKDLQDKKLVAGVSDPQRIEETTWTLTTEGTHKARKLAQ
jgi:hypothetical protein